MPSSKLRRVDHPWRIVWFLSLIVLLSIASFTIGWKFRDSDRDLLTADTLSVPVYSQVEKRVVGNPLQAQGQVVDAERLEIKGQIPDGIERGIVTHVNAKVGSFSSPQLIGSISNRPLFILEGEIPLFRNLQLGDRGEDVRSLRRSLGLESNGLVDWKLLNTVRELYKKHAYSMPAGAERISYISSKELLVIPKNRNLKSILEIANPGDEISDSRPFLTLGLGDPTITIRIGESEIRQIKMNQRVEILSSSETEIAGTVRSISKFLEADQESGLLPGRDVIVTPDSNRGLSNGQSVIVRFGKQSPKQMAVVASAIRSDTSSDYVYLKSDDGAPARVDVTVLGAEDGWAAISSDFLDVGAQVLVSP